MNLRISEPKIEGVFQASKWLKIQGLLDGDEMKSLLDSLGSFWIFPITGIVDGKPIEQLFFIAEYRRWIDELKNGIIPTNQRRITASVFIDEFDALWLQQVGDGKFLTKMAKPVVQVQAHTFAYSAGEFRPMSMGTTSIFWGLQFAFPQLYQDPKSMEFHETKPSPLFRKLQLWMRENSRATPFIVEGKKINSPIRLGKQCFSWINHHPQLIEHKIKVESSAKI